jgi:hypothetical protein
MPAAFPGVMFFGFVVGELVGDCTEFDDIVVFVGDVAEVVGSVWDGVGDGVGVAEGDICVAEAAGDAVPPTGGVDTMFVTSKKLPLYNVISVGLAITVTVVVVNVIVVPVVRPESTIVEVVPTIALLKFMFVVLR